MSIKNVLVIDDEPDICELLEITLARMGLESRSAQTVADALQTLNAAQFDLCLTDMRLPDGDGLEIVKYIQQKFPQIPVAVITAHGNVEAAVQALKNGAFDFVSKPIDLQLLRGLIESALNLKPDQSIPAEAAPQNDQPVLLGDSAAMQKLRKMITKLGRSQAPVFIQGESGTGKELVAREIHNAGPRADKPFIAVNCGAIPGELMESEFFGHTKGSFTGAITDKAGLFAAAEGGTLFLDEVADLPLNMQVKLLRAIQERAIRPIGEQHEHPVDVRILSASHKNLMNEVSNGRFRQDLFYRLNVIELKVPPLRKRKEDLEVLAAHFLRRITAQWNMPAAILTVEGLEKLKTYDFPGNVRELENILERACTLSEKGLIDAAALELPESQPQNVETPDSAILVEDLANREKTAIIKALEETRWNKTAAARLLGMTLR
ncbi:MAG TPA: sigma-54-dependent Fis family transcriptional regulator, partial [Gammaproteobacteria bacterium]|nr:sigma-54-dependent Fis family transcriptional regulator [Gammaproteobacteria bacterium]